VHEIGLEHIDVFMTQDSVLPINMVCTQLYSECGFSLNIREGLDDDSEDTWTCVTFPPGRIACNLMPHSLLDLVGESKYVIARFTARTSSVSHYYFAANKVCYWKNDEGSRSCEVHYIGEPSPLQVEEYTNVKSTFVLDKKLRGIVSVEASTEVKFSFSDARHVKRSLEHKIVGQKYVYSLGSFENGGENSLLIESNDGQEFDCTVFYGVGTEMNTGFTWKGPTITSPFSETEQAVTVCLVKGSYVIQERKSWDAIELAKQKVKRLIYKSHDPDFLGDVAQEIIAIEKETGDFCTFMKTLTHPATGERENASFR